MSSYVLDLFRRKKKKQQVSVSNGEKIRLLSEKAIGLFDHMKQAHDELTDINSELTQIAEAETEKIVEEHEAFERRIKQLEYNRDKALDEINMNTSLQGELAKFIR